MPKVALEDAIRTACLMECTAPKPGNVHPGASFEDLCYDDFVRSANAVAPIIARAGKHAVGRTVLAAVNATQSAVGKNTNLGILLLLVPLAKVPAEVTLRDGIGDVLSALTRDDAADVYTAIRLNNPGGMGSVSEGDVSDAPTGTLLDMMRLASERDTIAEQYATRFGFVLNDGLAFLESMVERFPNDWSAAVIALHLELMARKPDTLIARKLGRETAIESQRRAKAAINGGPEDIADFDRWLRADGHQRNPGTTADLVTATLFAGLREGVIAAPKSLGSHL